MESNLDGDCVAMMEEIDLINNDFSCTYICRLSNSKLVVVDGSISSVYSPVTGNISIPESTGGDDTILCHVANSNVGGSVIPPYLGRFLIVSDIYLIIRLRMLLKFY